MANDLFRSGILNGLLREAGVPVNGITVTDINASPVAVTVNYKAEATAEQRALGDQIAAQFDWRKRRPMDRATVVTAIQNLTANQRNTLLLHHLAEQLRNSVSLAAQIGTATGIPLTVDEVDPT